MKFIASKEKLLESINIVQKAVAAKSANPLLEGILIEAGEDGIKLTGNDLDIAIESRAEAEVSDGGSIVVDSKLFGEIVRRVTDSEDILISIEKNNIVVIDSDLSHFELKGINPEGFPLIPQIEKQKTLKIKQSILRDMVRQTIFSVCSDEFRPILTGSLFEYEKKVLTVVALDGNRVAIRRKQIEFEGEEFSVVIPSKTLNEIIKILQPVDDEISVYCSRNQIMFEAERFKIVSKLLEGEYFKYKYLLNKEYETMITVNTKKILQSIDRAYLISVEERDKIYPVRLSINDEKIVITSNTPIGSLKDEIEIKMTGNGMNIGYNPRYLIEALRVIDDENVNIYFASNPGPCSILPVSGEEFVYIVMSLRG